MADPRLTHDPPASRSVRRRGAPVRPRPRLALLVLPGLLTLVVAWVARHGFIEPAAWAFACEPEPWRGACALRSAVIASFARGEIGWAALGAGVLGLLLGAPRLAAFALALGAGGLVLYSYEPAAVGALLGLLVIVRRSAAAPAKAANKAA